jgi:hypothetical protein
MHALLPQLGSQWLARTEPPASLQALHMGVAHAPLQSGTPDAVPWHASPEAQRVRDRHQTHVAGYVQSQEKARCAPAASDAYFASARPLNRDWATALMPLQAGWSAALRIHVASRCTTCICLTCKCVLKLVHRMQKAGGRGAAKAAGEVQAGGGHRTGRGSRGSEAAAAAAAAATATAEGGGGCKSGC